MDALDGKKSAFKDLYSYAGSGNAEAQYYLALYYLKKNGSEQDEDCQYWLNKARDNGYDIPQDIFIPVSTSDESETIHEDSEEGSNSSLKKVLERFSFTGRINRIEYLIIITVCVIILLIFVPRNEDALVKSILILIINYFWYSQCVRRLHDFGASGWYILIPIITWIVAAFPKGDKGANEYGEAPK